MMVKWPLSCFNEQKGKNSCKVLGERRNYYFSKFRCYLNFPLSPKIYLIYFPMTGSFCISFFSTFKMKSA